MQQIVNPARSSLAVPALVLANVALAIGPWFVRIARAEGGVGPIGSGFWRLAIALPLLLVMARREGGEPIASRRALVGMALLSGLFFALDLGAWHAGILHTRLANATLLGNVTAILFPLYGFVAARALPSRRQAIALMLALGGALLLIGRSYELSARNLAGDFLCVLAGVSYTAYLIAVDKARAALGPWSTLCWAVAAGIPVLLAVALAMGDPLWPRIWWPLVLMSLGSQVIGQGLILYAVSRVPPLVVGVMLLLQPIVAATIGWVAYGERLTGFDLAGGVAIAVAVLLVRDAPRALPADEMRLSSAA